MKKITILVAVILCAFSCSSETDSTLVSENTNFLVFGHFYGMCEGEECVEVFKVTAEGLYEDVNDYYMSDDFSFTELPHEKFELVKDIVDYFPEELLVQNQSVYGCPDCADGGGVFIVHVANGNVLSWRIDQDKANIPEYLHEFVDKVNEKIALINN